MKIKYTSQFQSIGTVLQEIETTNWKDKHNY